jgi:hypothetical protein
MKTKKHLWLYVALGLFAIAILATAVCAACSDQKIVQVLSENTPTTAPVPDATYTDAANIEPSKTATATETADISLLGTMSTGRFVYPSELGRDSVSIKNYYIDVITQIGIINLNNENIGIAIQRDWVPVEGKYCTQYSCVAVTDDGGILICPPNELLDFLREQGVGISLLRSKGDPNYPSFYQLLLDNNMDILGVFASKGITVEFSEVPNFRAGHFIWSQGFSINSINPGILPEGQFIGQVRGTDEWFDSIEKLNELSIKYPNAKIVLFIGSRGEIDKMRVEHLSPLMTPTP